MSIQILRHSPSYARSFFSNTSFVEESAETLPKQDTLALVPQDVLEDNATLIPPFSAVLVYVDAIELSVECRTDASKLADAPALQEEKYVFSKCTHACMRRWRENGEA